MAPHRGAGPAFNDVLAGHIQMMSASVGGGFPFTQAGKLRPLGVGSPKRLAVLADTPTFIESGFAGFVASLWFGLGAPPNMPKPLVDRLSAELKAALEKPEVVAKLRSMGTDPEYLSPAEFSARASSDFEQWGKVLRDNNIKPD